MSEQLAWRTDNESMRKLTEFHERLARERREKEQSQERAILRIIRERLENPTVA